MRLLSLILVISICAVSTPFALATTATFKVEGLVSNGKKSKEVPSTLTFSDNSFSIISKKPGELSKEFNYADVKTADYSYSQKPLLSTGGAIATAVLLGLVVIPFLFMKKKQHWLSIRTEKDYVVLKLDKENFRQIQNEFQIRKVAVNTVDDTEKKKDK
jgi:hypothetical protein